MVIKCNRLGFLVLGVVFIWFTYSYLIPRQLTCPPPSDLVIQHQPAAHFVPVSAGDGLPRPAPADLSGDAAAADKLHRQQQQHSAFSKTVSLTAVLKSAVRAAQLGGLQVQRQSARMGTANVRSKGRTAEGANDPVTDGDLRSHCAMAAQLLADHPLLALRSEEETVDDKCAHIVPLPSARQGEHDGPGEEETLPEVKIDPDAIADNRVPVDDVVVWIDPLDATQEFTGIVDNNPNRHMRLTNDQLKRRCAICARAEKLFQYVTVMVCVAVRGEPTIGVIHNPFTGDTHWAWHRPQPLSDALRRLAAPPTLAQRPNRTAIVSRSHHGTVDRLLAELQPADNSSTGAAPPLIVEHAGGAGYKVLRVAAGAAHAYVHTTRIKKWDLCAGAAILRALGGRMTGFRGEPIRFDRQAPEVNELGVLAALGGEYEWWLRGLKQFASVPEQLAEEERRRQQVKEVELGG